MAWYDYVPVAGSVARLAQGDYKHAGADLIPIVGPYAYDKAGAFDEKRAGYDQAMARTGQLGDKMRQFYMQGLDRAENYYAPAVEMNKAVYGTPDKMRK